VPRVASLHHQTVSKILAVPWAIHDAVDRDLPIEDAVVSVVDLVGDRAREVATVDRGVEGEGVVTRSLHLVRNALVCHDAACDAALEVD
jgi:hypothetical protein